MATLMFPVFQVDPDELKRFMGLHKRICFHFCALNLSANSVKFNLIAYKHSYGKNNIIINRKFETSLLIEAKDQNKSKSIDLENYPGGVVINQLMMSKNGLKKVAKKNPLVFTPFFKEYNPECVCYEVNGPNGLILNPCPPADPPN